VQRWHVIVENFRILILATLEEYVGEFLKVISCDNGQFLVCMRSNVAILLPNDDLALFEGITPGTQIAILFTDDEKRPYRVRKLTAHSCEFSAIGNGYH